MCGHLHPRICQESWKTGKCDKGGRCGDGYHLGERIGKPRFGSNYGIPMGITEGPRPFVVRNHGGSSGKHSKRTSGKVTEIVLETDMTAKRKQGFTEEITTQVNKTVTKQPEKLEELEGQTRKMDSLKESQNDKRPGSWARVKTLSNWSLGFVLATICFTGTMDVVTIPSAKDHQEILQTGVREQQNPERLFIRYRGDL